MFRFSKAWVQGAGTAAVVATSLISRSAWFEVTPMPGDEWEFRYKAGEGTSEYLQRLDIPVVTRDE